VNKQLNVRMDALLERFEELNEKINRLKTGSKPGHGAI
jgi:hypothetical protein